jgi:long-chain fatty acid transport protein
MKSKVLMLLTAFAVAGATVAQPAAATDGHFLHGVGAINSTMGGVGIAMPADVLGAVYTNPAGLMAFENTRADFSFEMFKPTMSLSSTHPMGFSGSTKGTTEFTPIPALGFSMPVGDRAVVSLAGLGIGGFGVNYAAASVSSTGVPSNPILAPTTVGGFGQVYSDFQLMKIAPAFAFAASESVWLGAAFNFDWARLSVMPAPMTNPDMGMGMTPGGPAPMPFYPDATAHSSAFGVGIQLGLTWLVNDQWSLGLAYTSEQFFEDFEWNSTNKAPGSEGFGFPRTFTFKMNVPAVYGAGLAYRTESLTVGLDGKYITYSSTDGFKVDQVPPFNADGSVAGFAWDDIFVIATGLEWWASEDFALRAGYNYSDNPISDEVSFFNIPAPAIVQHHLTAGLGWSLAENVELNFGYYHVLENSISGPMYGPGAIPGSDVTSTMSENSFLIGFSFLGN